MPNENDTIQNTRHIRALELPKVLEMAAKEAGNPDSADVLRALLPSGDYKEVTRLIAQTADANSLSVRFGYPSIGGMKNCTEALQKARVGARLSMQELLDIAHVLAGIRRLIQWKKQSDDQRTALDHAFEGLLPNKAVEERITDAILSEDEMADTASPELNDLRRKIRRAGLQIREQLDKIIRSQSHAKHLQEQIITTRDGRFVVPVKAEFRGEIKGLVHDTSSSGATLFIEPMSVVEGNNEIRLLQNKEQQEMDRILAELSALVGDVADATIDSYNLAIWLDVIFAKSRLADRLKCSVPIITNDRSIALKRARHPLIDPAKIVPVDMSLGKEFDTLVITGPNTGGKTVALKTLGLMTLMAACGFLLPAADGSSVSVFDNVLCDIGDEQSIEQSLSTFSGHVTNIIGITHLAGEGSLILLDELGAGTDPVEGAALAVALIEHFRARGARIAATTHYAEIKVYALQTPGVVNGSCEFNIETLSPTYRLLIGVPGRSNAFAISERLGLDKTVIERAKELVSSENARFEDVVTNLEASRQQLENEREEARRIRHESETLLQKAKEEAARLDELREKELQKARQQAQSIVLATKAQSDRLLNELEDIKKSKDKEDFAARTAAAAKGYKSRFNQMHETADPLVEKDTGPYELPRPIRSGDQVLLVDLNTEGTVISGPDNSGQYLVQAGILKTKVAEGALRLIEKQARQNRVTIGGKRHITSQSAKNATSELDLRGMLADEAVIALDRFIDTALLSGLGSAMIIHGKGTGALRTAVQKRLREHRNVKSFRAGNYGEGDMGVTVVEFK